MRCIIVEDQPPAQRILKKYISDIGSLNLVGTFSDPLEAMEYLKKEEIQLMFLDINLPKISGIEFLKSLNSRPHVILTTAYSEFALESYELAVVDYLLKPFSFSRFVAAVNKVPTHSENYNQEMTNENPEIFIKSGFEHIRIQLLDILYIKSDGDYTEIYIGDKRYLSQESLKKWLETLADYSFIRTHKSYIINLQKIHKVAHSQVVLVDESTIPIGRAYKEAFEEVLRK